MFVARLGRSLNIINSSHMVFVETNVSGFPQYIVVTKKAACALAERSYADGYGFHIYKDDDSFNAYICNFKGRFERNKEDLANLYIKDLDSILSGSEDEHIREKVRRE